MLVTMIWSGLAIWWCWVNQKQPNTNSPWVVFLDLGVFCLRNWLKQDIKVVTNSQRGSCKYPDAPGILPLLHTYTHVHMHAPTHIHLSYASWPGWVSSISNVKLEISPKVFMEGVLSRYGWFPGSGGIYKFLRLESLFCCLLNNGQNWIDKFHLVF